MANTSYNTISVGTTATKIISANSKRKGWIITNESAVSVFVGPDASITTGNAISIVAGGSLEDSGVGDLWRGDIYGIVAASTADCRFWEWGQ